MTLSRSGRTPLALTTGHVRFEPEGGATRVTFEGDYEMPAHLPGFIKNLATKNFIERNFHQMLMDFKAFAEVTVPVPV